MAYGEKLSKVIATNLTSIIPKNVASIHEHSLQEQSPTKKYSITNTKSVQLMVENGFQELSGLLIRTSSLPWIDI